MDQNNLKKLEDFFSKHRLCSYKKGEIIYRPEDDPNHIAFIKSGYVRLFALSKEGEEMTINIFKPVFYFTLLFAMTKKPNRYYFEAITPVEMWKAPKEDVIAFIKSDPDLLFELSTNMLNGFQELLESIEFLVSGNAYSKVASALLLLSHRFGNRENNQITLDINPTHRELGTLTGVTRETVSVQIERLVKEGIITQNRQGITVNDWDALEEISSFGEAL